MTARFHERFDLSVDGDEARRRFMNRVRNDIFATIVDRLGDNTSFELTRFVASRLGENHQPYDRLAGYVDHDWYRCLRVLEACIAGTRGTSVRSEIDTAIRSILAESEIDLGVEWTGTEFRRTGAPALDRVLVNESLGRLGDPKYANVVGPFEKGLRHLLQSNTRPEVLADVVTDMYEALEAVAKITTGRPAKDLSGNLEIFVSQIGVSNEYQKLLKAYVEYANEFRHGTHPGRVRAQPAPKEVESFVYLTGIFLRLAIHE